MPLASMTGFGQAEDTTPSGKYYVEIRSVNNRFLEMQIRLPRSLANLETKVKKLVSSTISRGSVTVLITWSQEDNGGNLTWDQNVVGNYVDIFRQIQQKFNLKDEITLSDLLSFSDFLKKEPAQYSEQTVWKHLSAIFVKALENFIHSRQREAASIASDIKKIIRTLQKIMIKVEKQAPIRVKNYRNELLKKLTSLNLSVDQSRLAVEAAFMADKLDITEECSRLNAHIKKFLEDVESSEPIGKRMGFILQEMNREANTIGSKANDIIIAQYSVQLKENIEKLREQALNIE